MKYFQTLLVNHAMESLANLDSFVRTAELGSFTAAARQLALTPAAVSRNIAVLERNLGVRLFQRSTRKLTLTEAGERFYTAIGGHLGALQTAVSDIASAHSDPVGVLKLSMPPSFGIGFILPMLPAFRARYPLVRPEWHFENRQVNLVAEGYDAAIGGDFELTSGIVSRALAPVHIIAVASRAYMAGRTIPASPADFLQLDGIVFRSNRTGRTLHRTMRNAAGFEMAARLNETIIVNDPNAMREAAILGLGVALVAKMDVLRAIERGDLIELAEDWYADAGPLSIYYAARPLLPLKTRLFVDFLTDQFEQQSLAKKFSHGGAH